MITVKCPICNNALKVIFKNEIFEGWKQCKSCSEFSYVIAHGGGMAANASSAKSMHEIIDDSSKRGLGVKVLKFILENDPAYASDIMFNVGKAAEKELHVLEGFRIVQKEGNHYSITRGLEGYVKTLVMSYSSLDKKETDDSLIEHLLP